jgi:hypothetical protein
MFHLRTARRGLTRSIWLTLLLTGVFVSGADGDFVSPYALSDFTLTNSSFADGNAATPDNGQSVVFTGPNDGSGLAGSTALTVVSRGTGTFRFSWIYTSLDVPGFDSAGYLVNGQLFPLATANGQSGSNAISVHAGDVIGFRIDSADNTGGAGVLTISNFSAPAATQIPIPATSPLAELVLAVALSGSGLMLATRRTRKRTGK